MEMHSAMNYETNLPQHEEEDTPLFPVGEGNGR
jgi:hypothetical protein